MDNLEPWNMFTNDFMPDEGNVEDDMGEVAQDGGQGAEDVPFSIPSPVQDMQVKEEPQEAADEIFEDDNDIAPFHFLSAGASNNDNNNDSQQRNPEDDDALFDFGLESSNSQNRSIFNKSAAAEKDYPNLAPEDQYYNAMVKFEDAVIYICPACGHEFNSQDAWKNHLNVIHLYNTRRGLNFIQLDKLYHECMECHKRIAMHSMENLLKHKFTHLPYRCSKCMVCKRQYKYRQDLMVHLRMTHRDDLIALLKKEHKKPKNANSQPQTIRSLLSRSDGGAQSGTSSNISIGAIKENATDLFDNIEVKNEVLNEDEDDTMGEDSLPPPAKRPARDLPVFLEDGSTNGSAPEQTISRPNKSSTADEIDISLEEYILFTCPQCGTECETQAQWRQHIEFVHEFGTRRGLNFRELLNQQAQCMGCNMILSNSSIRSLQVHKFSHLPYKQWMSCKLCFTSFNLNRDIVKHLAVKHHLVPENNTSSAADAVNNEDDSQEAFGSGGGGMDDYDDGVSGGGGGYSKNIAMGQDSFTAKYDERDVFEQHITYICPACGKEYNDKKIWRKHIVEIHKLGELENLNFENINDRQLKCRECDKIITNAYGIQNAQQHRMTHMQYKSFAKCRLCRKTYTDRKGLIKHLRNSHKLGARGGFGQINPVPATTNYGGNSATTAPFKPFVKKPYKIAHYPPKEIVRLSNYTYEIVHLIEDDDDDDDVTVTGSSYDFAKGDAHLYRNSSPYNTPPSKRSSNMEQITRHKCVDCGSIFPTPQSLQHHIRQEHEFVDYQNSPSNPATQNEEQSNDNEDLLVPSRDADVQPEEPTTMECNFIYLCPQCGVEFRSQIKWRRHINVEHNFDKRESLGFRALDKFRYQCKLCKDTVTSSKLKGLQDHKFRHCPYKLYLKCLLCGQSYNHKPNMIAHLRQRHNIVEVNDGGGGGGGSGGSSMEQRHSSSNIRNVKENYNSSFSKEFNDAPARPIRNADPSVNNTNRPPGLKTVEDVISFHNAVDHETITYHCPSCNVNFDSHVFWRKHIVDEHNLNSREGLNFRQLDEHHYICLQCYKRVTVTHTKGAIGQLQSHKFRHLPYKSFRCTACQGEFVRKQMFFKHLDRSTNKCSGINPDSSFVDAADTSTAPNNDEDAVDFNATTIEPASGGSTSSSAKFSWPTRSSLPAQSSSSASAANSESISENQNCFTLNCPQCGADFETTRGWREHINIEHNLNNRTVLNFKKIGPKLHVCLECNEHVNGRKLRDLQVHKFKHLPYGAYLHCRFCSMKYFHISNMQEHLKNKHPNMVQKMKNLDDDCVTLDEEDESNAIDGNNDIDAPLDGDADESNPCLDDVVDMDLLEAEAEIEEVDPDNVESDEQYLLG